MAPIAQRRASVKELLDRVSRDIDQLHTPAMRALIPILVEAQAELARDLRKWLLTAEDGRARYTAQMYRRTILQIRAALDRARELEPALVRAFAERRPAVATAALKHLQEEFAFFSQIFEGSVTPFALDTTTLLAEGERLLYRRHETSAKRYAGQVGDDIRRQLAIGQVRGETIEQLTNRLVALGGPRGLVAVQGIKGTLSGRSELIAEGLFKRYRFWAERLVRTEIIHAYNVSADASIRDLATFAPGILSRWDASLDARICRTCAVLDGQTTNPGTPFQSGHAHPPAHPNCRCALIAWHPDWG